MKSLLFACLLLAVFACDDPEGAADMPPEDPPPAGPTWHADTAALITTHCAGCHQAGGAAPFALDSYASAAPLAAAIADSVSAGRMPPWNPSPDCRDYLKQRVLPDGAAETLSAWAAAGAPEGVDTGAPAPVDDAAEVEFEPNLITAARAPYMPDMATPDDYRCLVLDADFVEDTFVRGVQVVPDQGALVHHVLLYAIPPGDVAELMALDDAHPEPGYPCFGGVEVGLPASQGGWVPGQGASVWPDDRASVIQAGSKLVMQVHYNLAVAPSAPDQTAVHMMVSNEPPTQVVAGQPLATLDLTIDAGDAESTITREFTWYGDEAFEVVGLAGHMHLLGARMSVEIVRAGGSECVLDIPKWDFAWQEMFILAEPAFIEPGDRVRIECTFDNSAGNQPVVNGEQLAPRDVTWGEGTLDEMCFASLVRARDWAPELADQTVCAGVADCRADCDDPDSLACVARCVGEDRGCGQCMIGELARCGVPDCLDAFTAGKDCISDCLIFGGDPDACMTERCPERYAAIDACLSETIGDDGCPGVDACQPE